MFICPVCRRPLDKSGGAYRCESGHTYDIARGGYVNLLQKQSAKSHGDDKLMAAARRRFLEGGSYAPLRQRIGDALLPGETVDIGCGEGYYLQEISRHGICCGVDISKEAVRLACKREYGNPAFLAVAGCAALPLGDGSVDNAVSVFAPIQVQETARILRPGGRLVRVLAGRDHLMELKREIYETALPNPPPDTRLDGFREAGEEELKYTFCLQTSEDITALFTMTPYYYRTSPADIAKLERISALEITAHFTLYFYEKHKSTPA